MKKIIYAAVLLSLTLAVAGGCGKKNQNPQAEPEESAMDMSKYLPSLAAGDDAPDFEAPDVLGESVRLSDFKGSYVVLDFWATWCKDCRAEVPAMKNLYSSYYPKGVEFIGVSFDTDIQTLLEYGIEAGIPWPQVCNQIKWKENPISTAYDLHWIPTVFLISPEMKIIGVAFTARELEALLKENIK